MEKRDFVSKMLGLGAVISFTALISVVFLQIFARFLLPKTPSWTEEASRFLFIYSVAFSAPIALKRDEFVKVDLLLNKIPEGIREKLETVIYLVLSVFFLLVFYHGLNFARLGTIQTSPAMALPMFIPYGSIAFSSFFICLYSSKRFKDGMVKKKAIKKMMKIKEEMELVNKWN